MAIEQDIGKRLMRLLCERLVERLSDKDTPVSASEMEVVRKLLGDNSVTLASVQRGDFGAVAQKVAEEFPFQNTVHLEPMQ